MTRVPCLAFSTLLLLSAVPAAQTRKLNGPLPLNPAQAGGDVAAAELAPDDTRVVYLAREAPDQRPELRSLLLEGAHAAVKLTGAIPAEEKIHYEFEITPDGARVVFLTEQSVETHVGTIQSGRLYMVPIDGSRPPFLVVGPFVDLDLGSYRVSPDGAWIVFGTFDYETYDEFQNSVPIDGRHEPHVLLRGSLSQMELTSTGRMVYRAGAIGTVDLYSVGLDGRGRVRLNALLPPGGDVQDFQISPDEEHVVYRADQASDQVFELFRAPLDGSGAPVRVNAPLGGTADVIDFEISPDSTRVAYRCDQDVDGVIELFVAPIGGGGPAVKISGALVNRGDVEPDVQFTPDGAHVIYRADALADQVVQLFAAPADGSTPPTPLSGPHVQPNHVVGEEAFFMNAGRAVYRSRSPVTGQILLFSVPLDGSDDPILLSPAAVQQGEVEDFELCSDGSRVFFRADALVNRRYELYSAPVDGSSPASRINRLSSAADSSVPFRVTSDGKSTFYFGVEDEPGFRHLYRRRSDAAEPPVIVNGSLSQGDVQGDVDTFVPTTDGRIVYRADQSIDEHEEVLIVSSGGHPEPVRLSDPSTTTQGIEGPRLTHDRAVYVQPFATGPALFSVPLDRSAPPVQLSPLGPNSSIGQGYRFTPDESRVVFLFHQTGERLLVSALLDGSAPSIVLVDPPLATTQFKSALTVTPDGRRALYVSDATEDEVYRLYSVPVDGSIAPLALTPNLVAGGDVALAHTDDAPLVTPDGATAVYRADAELDERIELYAVAVDGSAAPRKLSGSLVTGGDVFGSFLLSRDGSRVVFAADALTDDQTELFVAPLDGGTSPVRLNTPLGPEGRLDEFRLAPDGDGVVYLAHPDDAPSSGLFATTLEGAPVVDLTAAAVPPREILEFEFDPTGAWIVYLASIAGRADAQVELFSVPADASAPPRRLSNAMILDGDVSGFHVAPDGTRIVYRADQDLDEVQELFVVPIDGRRGAEKQNPALPPGRTVNGFQISPDGQRLFYIADQEQPFVFELFQVPLPPATRGAAGIGER